MTHVQHARNPADAVMMIYLLPSVAIDRHWRHFPMSFYQVSQARRHQACGVQRRLISSGGGTQYVNKWKERATMLSLNSSTRSCHLSISRTHSGGVKISTGLAVPARPPRAHLVGWCARPLCLWCLPQTGKRGAHHAVLFPYSRPPGACRQHVSSKKRGILSFTVRRS
jgi:hypothetical protein